MDCITEKAYAKINLYLDVTGKRSDGYHTVDTVMQTVSLCDDVSVSLDRNGSFSLFCDVPGIPCDRRNLAWRAGEIFFAGQELDFGADIRIIKRIPSPAGLAGGSADAAAVLRALNLLCGKPYDTDGLCRLGSELGADVPFCIVGGTGRADGKGDILHGFPGLPDCTVVISCAGEGVSTPWAYGELDRIFGEFVDGMPHTEDGITLLGKYLSNGNLNMAVRELFNIFEAPVLLQRPTAMQIKHIFLENGALGAMMSGSGPAVFGIFDDISKAQAAVVANPYKSFLCYPVRKII